MIDQGAKVLVVDDEPAIRELCAKALGRAGHQVTSHEDGASALAAIASGHFDAAIFDIMLPGTDGLTLLRSIKQRSPEAVVVLVTGFASLETAMEAVRLGAYEYLRKPFSAADLVRIVNRGIEGQRLRGRHDALLTELRAANDQLLRQQEQLSERVRSANEDLSAFVDLGRELGESEDLTDTLRSILRAGIQVTHARAAAVYGIRHDPPRLQGIVTEGLAERDVVGRDVALDCGLLGSAAVTGVARIENDVLSGAIADDEQLGFLGVQSVLAEPLQSDGEVAGVIAFYDQCDGAFSEESLSLAQVVSAQAARVVTALQQISRKRQSSAWDDGFVDLADLL